MTKIPFGLSHIAVNPNDDPDYLADLAKQVEGLADGSLNLTETTTYEITGFYRPCEQCNAPLVDPWPTGFSLSLDHEVRARHEDGTVADGTIWLTPHLPGCPSGSAS